MYCIVIQIHFTKLIFLFQILIQSPYNFKGSENVFTENNRYSELRHMRRNVYACLYCNITWGWVDYLYRSHENSNISLSSVHQIYCITV